MENFFNLSPEEKLKSAKFFVEASSFEKSYLWKEWHEKLNWQQDTSGFGLEIGKIKSGSKKLPVFVSFNFALLNDVYVCFYNATSTGVDHNMIEKYITKKYPVKYDNNTRRAMCDADNFHNCAHFCIKPY